MDSIEAARLARHEAFESAHLALIHVRRFNALNGTIQLIGAEHAISAATAVLEPTHLRGEELANYRTVRSELLAADPKAVANGVKHIIRWCELLYAEDHLGKDAAEDLATAVCEGIEFADASWLAWLLDRHVWSSPVFNDWLYAYKCGDVIGLVHSVVCVGKSHEGYDGAGAEWDSLLKEMEEAMYPNGVSGDGPVAEGESNDDA